MKWFSLLVAVLALLGAANAGEAEAGKFRLVYESMFMKIVLTGDDAAGVPLQLHYEWSTKLRKETCRNAGANKPAIALYDQHQADIRLTPQEGEAFRLWIAQNQIPQLLAKEFVHPEVPVLQEAPYGLGRGWRALEIQTAEVQVRKRWAQSNTQAPEALHQALLQLGNLCAAVVAEANKQDTVKTE